MTGEFLEKWIAHIKLNVAVKTAERYAEIVRCHLIPAFEKTPLNKLHPPQLDAYYTEALQSGRRRGTGGLSARTVTHHHRILRQALTQAVRWRLLTRNPADDTKPPRPVRREMKALDEQQMLALFKRYESSRLYAVVVTAGTTGLRRGELLGLNWSDIDLEAGKLTVARSLEETKADGAKFKSAKTPKARRVIDLLPRTIATLRHHATEQKKERLAAGPVWHDEGPWCSRT